MLSGRSARALAGGSRTFTRLWTFRGRAAKPPPPSARANGPLVVTINSHPDECVRGTGQERSAHPWEAGPDGHPGEVVVATRGTLLALGL